MSKHLFLLTVGPVQSFISQARKTHDLWAGSRILSELLEKAAQIFIDRGGKLIYPVNLNSDSLSNRILGEIDVAPEQLKAIGESAEKKAREYFSEIAKNAFNKTCGEKTVKPQGFDEQIQQHLEIRWLFYPQQADYATDYAELTALAAAMKNTRDFAQFGSGSGEKGRKCSLDGNLNALFYRPRPDNTKLAYLQSDAIKIERVKLKPGEGLSAVSLCKRFYRAKEHFPRASAVALMDYLEELEKEEWSRRDKALRDLFKDEFDEELYFEENLTFKYFQQEGLNTQKLEQAKEYVKGLPKPYTRYYALLAFDGDSMGNWLSGNYLKDKTQLRDFHTQLSNKLADFAKYALNYLKEPRGKAVYAGGDDFLGFINLASLFPVLAHLRSEFAKKVTDPLKKQFKLERDLTFSGGVVVTHYRTPLHIVLQRAREAEKAAKDIRSDKDALSITVMKRSGESNQAILPWFDGQTALLTELAKIIENLRGGFSDTFIRRLAAEFFTHTKKRTDQAMFLSELRRLTKRAAPEVKDKKERIDKLNNVLANLLQAVKSLYGQPPTDDDLNPQVLDNFLQALYVAVFLQRQGKGNAKPYESRDAA